jgi:hypothetical protein
MALMLFGTLWILEDSTIDEIRCVSHSQATHSLHTVASNIQIPPKCAA